MKEENQNVFYIFDKPLTEHLKTTKTNERYLDHRIERFREEFLDRELTFGQLETILECVEIYLGECLETQELVNCLVNLKQSMYWLDLYGRSDYE